MMSQIQYLQKSLNWSWPNSFNNLEDLDFQIKSIKYEVSNKN